MTPRHIQTKLKRLEQQALRLILNPVRLRRVELRIQTIKNTIKRAK